MVITLIIAAVSLALFLFAGWITRQPMREVDYWLALADAETERAAGRAAESRPEQERLAS